MVNKMYVPAKENEEGFEVVSMEGRIFTKRNNLGKEIIIEWVPKIVIEDEYFNAILKDNE
jgi:hypothetical protein